MSDVLALRIGSEPFTARLRRDLAPQACGCLLELLPYAGKLIHARWSGEALWAPLAPALPAARRLLAEHPIAHPAPGEVLLYAGGPSEPELYFPYGPNGFACKFGPLQGEPVLRIEGRLERLAALGHEALWKGAQELHIEVSP